VGLVGQGRGYQRIAKAHLLRQSRHPEAQGTGENCELSGHPHLCLRSRKAVGFRGEAEGVNGSTWRAGSHRMMGFCHRLGRKGRKRDNHMDVFGVGSAIQGGKEGEIHHHSSWAPGREVTSNRGSKCVRE